MADDVLALGLEFGVLGKNLGLRRKEDAVEAPEGRSLRSFLFIRVMESLASLEKRMKPSL